MTFHRLTDVLSTASGVVKFDVNISLMSFYHIRLKII